MAESYRGLTIRIGGDTSGLAKALKGANGAISQTDMELRKLGQAMKMDPGNVQAFNMQLGYMSDKATDTAMKLHQLKAAQEQIGSDRITLSDDTTGTVEELAKAFGSVGGALENVSGRIAVAKAGLADITETTAAMHREVSELTKEAAKVERMKLASAFDLATGKRGIEEVREKFASLNDGIERTPEMIDEIVGSVKEMGRQLKESIHIDEGTFDVSGLKDKLVEIFRSSGFEIRVDDDAFQKRMNQIDAFGDAYKEKYEEIKAKSEEATRAQAENVQRLVREAEESLAGLQTERDQILAERGERSAKRQAELESLKANAVEMTNRHFEEQAALIEEAVEESRKLDSAIESAREKGESLREEAGRIATVLGNSWSSLSDDEKAKWAPEQAELGPDQSMDDWWDSMRKSVEEAGRLDAVTGSIKTNTSELLDLETKRAQLIVTQSSDQAGANLLLEDAIRAQLRNNEEAVEAGREAVVSKEREAELTEILAGLEKQNKDTVKETTRQLREQSDAAAELYDKVAANRKERKNEADEYKKIISVLEEAKRVISEGGDASGLFASLGDFGDDLAKNVRTAQDAQNRIDEVRERDKSSRNSHAQVTKVLNAQIRELEEKAVEDRKKAADNTAKVDEQKVRAKEEHVRALEALVNKEGVVDAAGLALDTGPAGEAYRKLQEERRADDKRTADQLEANARRWSESTTESCERIQAAMRDTSEEGKAAAQAQEELARLSEDFTKRFAKFGQRMPGIAGELFNNASGNTDPSYIASVVDKISASLGLSAQQTLLFKDSLVKLHEKFKDANDDVQKLEKVAKYDDLLVEITKTEAGVKSLSKAMADMHVPSDVMRGMHVLNENTKELDAAYKVLAATGRSLSESFRADPSNTEAATQAMNAYAAAEMVAYENMVRMQERVDKLDANAVRLATDSTKSAAQQLFDASVAAQKAKESYADLSGELQHLEAIEARLAGQQTETLDLDIINDEESMAIFEAQVEEAAKSRAEFNRQIAETRKFVEEADEANRTAARNLEDAKIRKEYEDAAAGAASWTAELKRASDAMRETFVQQSVSLTFGDMSSIDGMSTQMAALRKSAGVFEAAMKVDSGNIEIAAARTRRLSEAGEIAARQIEELRQKIERGDSSKLDELRAKYGSVTAAVAELRKEASSASDEASDAAAKVVHAVNSRIAEVSGSYEASQLRGILGKLLDPDADWGEHQLDFLPESIRSAYEEVVRFGDKSTSVMHELAEAEKAATLEGLVESLVSAQAEYDKLLQSMRVDTTDMAQQASVSIRDAFGTGIFSGMDKQVDDLTEVIEAAKARIASIDDALKDESADRPALLAERMQAVTEAVDATEKRSRALNDTFERLGGDARLDELRSEFGSVTGAVQKMTDELEETVGQIGSLQNYAVQFAKDNGLTVEWVEGFKAMRLEADQLPEGIRKAYETMTQLSSQADSQRESLGLASVALTLEEIRNKGRETGDSLLAEQTKLESKAYEFSKDVQKYAEEAVASVRESFGTGILSGVTSQLSTLDNTIRVAESRIKGIDEALGGDGADRVALLEERFQAVAEAADATDAKARLVKGTLESFGAEDKIDELRTRFGSVTQAVDELGRNVLDTQQDIGLLRVAIDEFANANNLGEEWADGLKNLKTSIDDVPEGIRAAYAELQNLTDRLSGENEELAFAALMQTLEGLVPIARQTGDRYIDEQERLEDRTYEFAHNVAEASVGAANKIRDAFGGGLFDDTEEQIKVLDDVISAAKAKVKDIDAQIKAGGDEDALVPQRVSAVEEAAAAAEKRLRILNSVLEDLGGQEQLERLRSEFGSVGEAVYELRNRFAATYRQLDELYDKVDAFANEHNLGKEWADGFKDVSKAVDEVPEGLEGVRDEITRVLGTISDAGSELGRASAMRWVEGFSSKMAEDADRIRDDLKVKVKVELDDSLSKDIKSFADDMKNLRFDGSGADEFVRDFSLAGESVKLTKEHFDKLKSALKDSPKDAGLLADTTKAAESYAAALAKRIEAGRKALEAWDTDKIDETAMEMGTVGAKLKKAQDELNKTQKEAEELEKKLKDARQRLSELGGANTDEAEKEVRQLEDSLEDLKGKAEDAKAEVDRLSQTKAYQDIKVGVEVDERSFEAVKKQADSGLFDDSKSGNAAFQQSIERIGQYAEQAGQKIVESANTIDSAYRDMRKTVNGTEEQFSDLRKEAVKFSQTNAVSADTILEMEALGGQLGVAISELQSFGEVASHLDIATDIGAQDIALQMGQLSNIMSDFSHDQFDDFANSLVRLGNNMPTTESAIMEVAQRMAAVANVTSMTTPELLSWAAAIASTGQRSESAATAINNTITGIGAAVAEGGSTLAGFAKIANMTSDEFKQAWEESSTDALKAFVKGLETLTDDSTDAIAALDSVGISGVRQRTALLALSQTIDNLDESLQMSTNAWNGVSDEWGNAGDAANEARNKSEGFSGSLQILRNNASNLAAALGDGLVGPMNVLAGALQILTNFLDAMPAPMKTVVVSAGGLAAAFGILYPVIKEFTEGWKEITGGNGFKAAVFDEVSSSLEKLKAVFAGTSAEAAAMGPAGEVAAGGATAVGTASTGAAAGVSMLGNAIKATFIGLIAVAVLAAINGIVEAYNEWREHTEQVEKATTGLTSAIGSAGTAYDSYSKKAKNAAKSLDEVRDAANEATEAQASLADDLKSRWEEVGTNAAMVDEYAKTIEELTKKQALNREEQVELAAAVEGYNSITGESVSILDEEAGILDTSTESILANADAWKKRAESEAAFEMYKDVLKQRIQDEIALEDVRSKLNATTERAVGSLEGMYGGVSATSAQTAELKRKEKELEDSIRSCDETMKSYEGHMLTTQEKLAQVEAALSRAGDSLNNYKDLTDSDLAKIASSWNGKTNDILELIKELSKASSEASEISPEAAKPSDDQYKQYKDSLDDLYTEEKRLRDRYQEDVKRGYDKELTDFKNQQAKIYQAEKDARDDLETELKNQLDREYEQEKRARDAIYDARKAELDKEYDAAKDASSKYLKLVKDEQSRAVDEFKDATDKRVKEMKREYEAKKKLIKDETKADTDAVDAKIQALRDQMQAEEDAKKLAEDQAEVDELVSKVNSAKTTKSREAAEKNLQDKLDELEEERSKRRIEDRIEAYEREKDAIEAAADKREDVLEDSYDREVERYKESREKQLELMKQANEAEYDRIKALEDAKLATRKAANEAELKALKLTHDDELSEIKLQNDRAIELQKRAHEAELTDIKNAQDAEYQSRKYHYDDLMTELKQHHEDELNEIKAQNDRLAEAYKNGGQAAVDALLQASEAASTIPESIAAQAEPTGEAARQVAEQFATVAGAAVRMVEGVAAAAVPFQAGVTNFPAIADAALSRIPEMAKSSVEDTVRWLTEGLTSSDPEIQRAFQQLVESFGSDLGQLEEVAKATGANIPTELHNAIAQNADKPGTALTSTSKDLMNILRVLKTNFAEYGEQSIIGWNNSFVKHSATAVQNANTWASNTLKTVASRLGIHSPSRAFGRLADYSFAGWDRRWDVGEESALRSAGRFADGLVETLSDVEVGADPVQGLIDSMRAQEDALRAQAERMAEIVESGFDPELTVAAAYEAIDRIDAGEMRRQASLMAPTRQETATTYTVEINVTGNTISSELDVDAITREIERRMRRILSSQIG